MVRTGESRAWSRDQVASSILNMFSERSTGDVKKPLAARRARSSAVKELARPHPAAEPRGSAAQPFRGPPSFRS